MRTGSADERWHWFGVWGLKRNAEEARKLVKITGKAWALCRVAPDSVVGRKAKKLRRRAYEVISASSVRADDVVVKVYYPPPKGLIG